MTETATRPTRVVDFSEYIPDRVPRADRHAVVLGSCPWLLFLLLPAVVIVAGDDVSIGWKVLGLAGIAVFAGTFVFAMLHARLFRTLPRWVSTLFFTAALVLATAVMFPAAGLTALNTTTFVAALWIFCHRLRIGLPAALAVAVLTVLVVLALDGAESQWVIIPLAIGLLILLLLRFGMAREEAGRLLGEELALSQQREELARDVHDVLGHSLTVVTVKAELARRLIHTDPDRAARELDDLLGITRTALADVRSTVGRLSRPELGGQLIAAERALAAADIRVILPAPAAVRSIPAEEQELFAWCLREAVTNVVRHSGATRCTVHCEPGLLRVTDDGVGPGDIGGRGSGVAGMRARVAEAGGTLTVAEHRPGAQRPGTRVEVRV